MAIKRYQIIILLFLLPMPAAFAAADCLDKTCVDVFTEDNQLIITAQKGAAKPTPPVGLVGLGSINHGPKA